MSKEVATKKDDKSKGGTAFQPQKDDKSKVGAAVQPQKDDKSKVGTTGPAQKDDKSKVGATVAAQKDDKSKVGAAVQPQKDDKSKVGATVAAQKDDKSKVGAAVQPQKEEGLKGASAAKESDPIVSKSEIISLIENTVSETLPQRMLSLQSEASVHKQELRTEIEKLKEEFHDTNTQCLKRIDDLGFALSSTQQRFAWLENYVQTQLDAVIEQKIRWIQQQQQKLQWESGASDAKWSEQLATRESAHQRELAKLREQHHQDMLSVINDCCRKLKSGFASTSKTYKVDEIHAVIDDTEQTMVQEILLEIQKTNAQEDFSDALATVKRGGELGKVADDGGNASNLTADDITAALGTFESENFGSWAEELQPSGEPSTDYGESEVPLVQEQISRHEAPITGDRGNIYYAEELKRTVDEMISQDEKTAADQKNAEELAPDVPSNTKTVEELEESLESIIIPDSPGTKVQPVARDQKKAQEGTTDAKTVRADVNPDTSRMDFDQLKSLEDMIEKDVSFPDFSPEVAKSIEGKTEGDSSVTGSQPAKSTTDLDQLKSLEEMIEADIAFPDILSAVSDKDQGQVRPQDGGKGTDTTDALEAMIESSMIDDTAKTQGHVATQSKTQPTGSAKQVVKETVSGNVAAAAATSSPSAPDEMHAIPTSGHHENPFYVEEIMTTASKPKDIPKTEKA